MMDSANSPTTTTTTTTKGTFQDPARHHEYTDDEADFHEKTPQQAADQEPDQDDPRTLEKHESAAQDLTAQGTMAMDLTSLSREAMPRKPSRRGVSSEEGGRGHSGLVDENAGQGPGGGGVDGEDEEEEETYPEGGLKAWTVVLGSWLALFSALGLMNSLATFQTYVAMNQLSDYSEGSVGWIFSVYVFLAFGCGIYIGPVFDKYGPRWLILGGTVCLVTGMMLFSICTEYWHFMLTFGILNGFGASLIYTPSIAAVGHWFHARRALATGVASTGGSLGGIVFPLIMQDLFERVGWAWAIRTIGFICLLFCGTANFLIRARLKPAQDATPHPDIRIFRNVAFALTTLGIFLLEFALFIPLTYITSYMINIGEFGETFSFRILAILNAGSAVGRVLAGWWGDHFGAFNSNMLAVLLSVVACLAIWLPFGKELAGIVIFALLFGFASGNNISISPVCVGRLCKTRNYGRYYATTYTAVSVACLVGIPIAGEIVAASGGEYLGLIIFTGGVYLLSFAALQAAKIVCVGWKPLAIF